MTQTDTPWPSGRQGKESGALARIRERIIALYGKLDTPYLPRMVILGGTVGVVGGLGAVIFHYLILGFKYIFWGATSTETFLESVRALPFHWRLIIPAIGGLIVGPLVTYVVKEAKGHGVPEVMEAVALRSGSIRFRVAPLKAIISAICIGSGGAAGREGPIVQIGATFGSAMARYLKLTPEKIETLLGAGAAAGIAGTFNAPMAGVIFSTEVLIKKVKLDSFSPIVVAAVVGTAVANKLFERGEPVFDIPIHEMVSYWELFFYIGLGIMGAGVALLYSNTLYGLEHLFEKVPAPVAFKAATGGLLLGVLALALPEIHSTGYPIMEQALHGDLALRMVFLLMLGKILATSLTLGSGGSGGIFAPALFIGAMMGATYGMIIHSLFPNITAGSIPYAIVGMGTVFAGATHAPLTSIIILFEMTRDPMLMVPMMFSCILCSVLTARLQKSNIYTRKLLNRGVDIEEAEQRKALQSLSVGDVMNTHFTVLSERSAASEAKVVFLRTTSAFLPIVQAGTDKLIGLLSYRRLVDHLAEGDDGDTAVGRIADRHPLTVCKHDTLQEAWTRLADINLNMLPVLEGDGSRKIVGMLSRGILERTRHDDWLLYLSADNILLELEAGDSDSAIREICLAIADKVPGHSAEELVQAVIEREKRMNTDLEGGVAFPHARISDLERPLVILARSTQGIEWGPRGKEAARLIFLALVPEDDIDSQLQIARGIAETTSDEKVRQRLLRCRTAAEELECLGQTLPADGESEMTEVTIPGEFIGRSLRELNVRGRFGVTVLGIRRMMEDGSRRMILDIDPDEPLESEDRLIIAGKEENIAAFPEKN